MMLEVSLFVEEHRDSRVAAGPGDRALSRWWQSIDPRAVGGGRLGSGPAEPLPAVSAEARPKALAARVMVVDDVTDVLQLLRDYLESEGYTVEAFAGAEDALLRIPEFRPRVVLLDILMPGLSGISALQRIRAEHPDVEVVMVTGAGDEEVAKRALALGAFDYVTKPIDLDYLKWAVETCLLMRPR